MDAPIGEKHRRRAMVKGDDKLLFNSPSLLMFASISLTFERCFTNVYLFHIFASAVFDSRCLGHRCHLVGRTLFRATFEL
jgi:hypothetical protein